MSYLNGHFVELVALCRVFRVLGGPLRPNGVDFVAALTCSHFLLGLGQVIGGSCCSGLFGLLDNSCRQILTGIDVQPQPEHCKVLDQATHDCGVDVEHRGSLDGLFFALAT